MSIDKAKEIIFEFIPGEVDLAHNAIGIYISLAEHAKLLNQSSHRTLFGFIQQQSFAGFVMSVSKLFERQNPRYPNYSIPTALSYLLDNIALVPVPVNCPFKFERFIQNNIDSSFHIQSQNDIRNIPEIILNHFAEKYPRTPARSGYRLDAILDAIQVLRDKRVAHHEDRSIQDLSKTDLDSVLQLLAFAKTFMNIVAYGFFGFSLDAIADPAEFEPDKSITWAQMNKIVGNL